MQDLKMRDLKLQDMKLQDLKLQAIKMTDQIWCRKLEYLTNLSKYSFGLYQNEGPFCQYIGTTYTKGHFTWFSDN